MRKRSSFVRLGAAVAALSALLGLPLTSAPAAHADDPAVTLTTLYDAEGSSTIGSIGVTMPIDPTLLTETLDVNTSNIIDGTMPIPSQRTQFDAFGFIPMRATVSLTQVGPITGTLRKSPTNPRDLVITSDVAYTIRLSDVEAKVFGVWTPMFVGDHCRTADPVQIHVATPAGESFNVFTGGTVEGTYTIGNFTGCHAFFIPGLGSVAVNALVPGSDNAISLQLSNGRHP